MRTTKFTSGGLRHHQKGKTMTVETNIQTEGLEERTATADETQSVDFSHPDIMRARAAVYALLLQWAKERKEKEAREQAIATAQTDGKHTCEQACENPDSEYTDRNQNPTPADTEVGER
jgi:hypothetical protein